MCHVACGKLDCYYEDGYGGPWDVAAGFVIVTEASDPLACTNMPDACTKHAMLYIRTRPLFDPFN